MAGLAPLPGSVLPEEFETGPISQPISAPNQFGGVIAQPPINPAQAINDAAQYSRFHDTVRTLPPGAPLPGAMLPGAPAPLPAAGPMEGPLQQPIAPGAAPAPAPAAPAHGGGGGGRAPKIDQNLRDLQQAGQQGIEGIQRVQETKAEGDQRLADTYRDLSVQQQMDAQELRDTQETQRVAQQHMEEQEASALKQAKDYTIPDFWKGSEGARVGSVLAIAMGGIASAITGGPNGALQIINKNVDDYFHRQKEKVDNLYKYAEQTGRLNDRVRVRYAQELTNLQAQHIAVQGSILTRIESVKAQNQGNVEAASTDGLLAAAKTQLAKDVDQYRQNQAHISLMGAQTNAANANAFESRAKGQAALATAGAGGAASPKLLLQLSGQVQQQIDKDPEAKETFKALQKYQEAQSALQSGTGIGNKLVIDEITKAATGLGARPQSIKVFEQATGGAWERLKGDIQKLQTGNALTPAQAANVQKFLDYTIREKEQKLQGVRERIAGGMKANPAYSAHPEVIEGALSQHFGAPRAAQPAPAQDVNAQARAWAAANPNDPRSAQILARLGGR